MWFLPKGVKRGEGELTLFFDSQTSQESRHQFEEYIATHLQRRALPETVRRRQIFSCSQCFEAITDNQVRRRLERGFSAISCPVCEIEILLISEKVAVGSASVVSEIDPSCKRPTAA